MLLLLSSDDEVIFLEEEETDDAGLTNDFLAISSSVTSDAMDVLKFRPTGDTGTDFLVSEVLARTEGLVRDEDIELRLSSGRDLLAGSVTVERLPFFLTVEFAVFFLLPSDVNDFSINPPVLFPLVTETEFVEPLEELVKPDFFEPSVESETLLSSTRFLTGAAAVEPFDPTATLDFPVSATLLTASDDELT